MDGSPGLYRWSAGAVHAGRYAVSIAGLMHAEVIDTGTAGRTDVAIVVGAPADVVVHLQDDRTGDAVLEEWLVVMGVGVPIEHPRGSLDMATCDPATRTPHCRVPAGVVAFDLLSSTYQLEDRAPITLHPGRNTLTLRVRALGRVRIQVAEDGRRVDFPLGWFSRATVRSVGGGGVGYPSDSSPTGGTISVTERGLYEITLPELPGYEPLPPFQVDVPARDLVEYEIDLRRSDGSRP